MLDRVGLAAVRQPGRAAVAALATPVLLSALLGLGWAGGLLLSLGWLAGLGWAALVWDPPVKSLLLGRHLPSGAARTCAATPQVLEAWSAPAPGLVPAMDWYKEYHGHPPPLLAQARARLAEAGCARFVYMVGDSTLDNKHWLTPQLGASMLTNRSSAAAVNGFEAVLSPGRMVMDVAYFMNKTAQERLGPGRVCTLMTAVEESTLADRHGQLLAQDCFVRDHISEKDYLVVSVGGNDVALAPSLRTALSMLVLTRSPHWLIRSGWAPGFGHFVNLFWERTLALVDRVCARRRPAKVLVCMLYYLDERPGGSWADQTLEALGYNRDPSTLQLIMRQLFAAVQARAARHRMPAGCELLLLPLFEVLDGKRSSDYVQRVEPSIEGGRKMAEAICSKLLET